MDSQEYRKELGKYFIDISKLIFGGAVLTTIIKVEKVDQILILLLGGIATFTFAIFGFYILKNKK